MKDRYDESGNEKPSALAGSTLQQHSQPGSAPDDHNEYDDGECWQCGGEGRVAGTCIDGCCLEQDNPDCPYCSRRCDVCNPGKPRT